MADEISDQVLGIPRRNPVPPNGGTDDAISDMVLSGPESGRLRVATDAALQTEPSRASRILRAGARTGLPEDLVEEHLDDVERMARSADFDPERFRKNAPLMAKWLQESKNRVRVLYDDRNGLADLEQIYRRRNDPARPPTEQEVQAGAERSARHQAELSQLDTQLIDPSTGLTQDIPPLPKEDVYKRTLQDELDTRRAEARIIAGQTGVGFFESLGETWRKNKLFAVPVGGVMPVLQNAIELKLAAERVAKGKGAYANYDLDMDLLTRYDRMEKAAQRRGTTLSGKLAELGAGLPAFVGEMALTGGLSVPVKVGAGLAVKAGAFALETTAAAALTQGPKVLAGAVRRQTPIGEAVVDDEGRFSYQFKTDTGEPVWLSLSKEMVSSVLDVAGAKVPFGPIYKLLSKEVGEATAKTLTDRLLRVGKEGVQGALSGITINEATKLAKAITMVGPAYELPSGQDLAAQSLVFGGLGGFHAGVDLLKRQKADSTLRTIQEQRSKLDSLDATMKEPALVEQSVAAATRGTPEEFVYVPVEEVKKFYQDKGLDPRSEIEKILGSADKYDQAAAAGNKIQIPTSRYAMSIDRDPEASKFFEKHVTFDPLDPSSAEIEQAAAAAKEPAPPVSDFRSALESTFKSLEGGADPAARARQFEDSGRKISAVVQERLRELGMNREAEHLGRVYEERYKARAERRALGEDPVELFDKLGLRIFKREGPGAEIPPGEGGYVRVLEQGQRDRIERVPGSTPAETALEAGRRFPGATVEPLTPQEAARRVFNQPAAGDVSPVDGGPLFHEFKGNAAGAIEALKSARSGEAVGALHHPDVGPIDLIWGKGGAKGYGLAKILEKHPEAIADLQGLISSLKVKQSAINKVNKNSILLESPDGFAIVRLNWMGKAKRWLLTAYEKEKPSAPRQDLDVARGPEGGRADTAPPPAEGSEGSSLPKDDFESDRKLFAERGGIPRGNIEFGPEGPDINLFRNADRSTFMHESGHLWLDELIQDATTAGVPEQLRGDLDKVLTWLGSDARAKDGRGEVLKKLTVDQQEKWAGAVEAYLMEGKAPSVALRGVFYRFATWLKKIYTNLLGLEAQAGQKLDLNPEVRSVLDRLLATDEQINEAHQGEGVRNVLAGADWLPEKDREEISKALAEVDLAAKEELNKKLMAQVRKEESAQWSRERAGVRSEVADQVDQQPDQVALANLERGTRPDGSPLGPEDPPALKINRQAAVDAYGKEVLSGLPRRIFTNEGGLTPDDAAEQLNFSSGDELLQSIRKLREPQTPEELEIRRKLEGIEMQRKLLLEAKAPIEAEKEEAVKNLKAGRKTLANRLEASIRAEERSKIQPIAEILQDLKGRGGIQPTSPTEDLPKEFRAKKKGGVGSDVIAQELADRGLIDSADSDVLYRKLAEWQKQVEASNERAAAAPAEARRLAGERVSSSIEALVENAAQGEQLRGQLARVTKEAQEFRRNHAVNQREALIDRLTDQKMQERFPDLLTDGTLPEEAVRSVYNAKRAQLLARQLELLAEHKLPAMKKMVGILAARGGFSDLVQAQAETQIANLKVREVTPGIYRGTAKAAAAEAARAFGKGEWSQLFDALRKELLNHELYRAAEHVRDESQRITEYMGKFNKNEVRGRIGKAGGDYLDQIDAIMERFDFRKSVTLRNVERRQSLRDWYNDQVRLAEDGEGYMPAIPPKVLDEAFRMHYGEMTFEQLQDVYDAARNIEHLASMKNRLLANVERKTFLESVDEGVDSIVRNSAGPRQVPLEPRSPGWEPKKRGVEGLFASLRKMASLAREMDGFKDGGAMWELFIRPANHAGNREATMQAEVAEKFDKLLGQYSPNEQRKMHQKESIPGLGDSLSRWGQIMVALNSGNEGNLQRLRDGYRWTDEQISSIRDRLSAKDWEFVRATWKLIDSYWPQIEALHKRVTGIAPDKVEAKPFQSPHGEQPGGYFPIKYEPIRSPRAAENIAKEDAKPTLMGATLRSTTRHGHREARFDHVEQPLRLDPGVINEHLNQVIHDLAHYEFVTDTNRLLANEKLRQAIVDHYGDQNYAQLKDWVRDIAVGIQPAKSKTERGLNWLRQGSVVARLGWNLKQFVMDQTGILQGIQRVGAGWVGKGYAQAFGDAMHLENSMRKIEEKSEFMANRSKTRIREINEVMGQVTQKGTAELYADIGLDVLTHGHVDAAMVKGTFFELMAKAQKLQDAPVWLGAYEKALAEHPVESEHSPADRERIEKRAVDLADQAVIDSFGSGQLKDLAQVQRGGPAWKVYMTFASFMNATLQRNVEAVKLWKKEPASLRSHWTLATDLMLVNVIPAAIATLIGHALTGGDDKKLVRDLATDQAAQLLNQLPLGRELGAGLHGRSYEGPPGTEAIVSGNELIKSAKEGKMDWRAANETAGSLFHYPSTALQRIIDSITAYQQGRFDIRQPFFGGGKKR